MKQDYLNFFLGVCIRTVLLILALMDSIGIRVAEPLFVFRVVEQTLKVVVGIPTLVLKLAGAAF